MALGNLFQQVLGAITQHSDNQQQTGFNPGALLSEVSGLFQNHAAQTGDVLPASQDPYGDPANNANDAGGGILPASQDPYGDPADQQ